MTLRIMFVLLLCSIGAMAAQEEDGLWWSKLDNSFKLGYVAGFAEGHQFAAIDHLSACEALWIGGVIKAAGYTFEEWREICFPKSDFGGIRVGQLVDGVDSFYRDYRNQKIEISSALAYVRDEIKGRPQAELDDRLAKMRKAAAGENPFEKKPKSER